MLEFMNEDELLHEFHKAGIWLPEEKEARQRAMEPIRRSHAAIDNYAKVSQETYRMQTQLRGSNPFADALRTQQLASLQRIPSAFERQLHDPRQQQRFPSSVFGGLLGGLF